MLQNDFLADIDQPKKKPAWHQRKKEFAKQHERKEWDKVNNN